MVVRFAGDSGDGMQLTGGQFTLSTALAGNDLATFPDFPAEIRAPQGTLFGVSAFQINFGSREINTAGDAPDVLVAMNPAALKVNLDALQPGGLIIADSGEFTARKPRLHTGPDRRVGLVHPSVVDRVHRIEVGDVGEPDVHRDDPRLVGASALEQSVDPVEDFPPSGCRRRGRHSAPPPARR